MFKVTNKIVSIVLIISLILSNVGVSTFADSINDEQSTTAIVNENAGDNIFGENTNPNNNIVNEEKNDDKEKLEGKDNQDGNEKPEIKDEQDEDEKPEDKEEPEENENNEDGSSANDGEGSSENTSDTTGTSDPEGTDDPVGASSASANDGEGSSENTSDFVGASSASADATTDSTSKSKIEDEENTKIATASDADDNNLFSLENDNKEVATDSDAENNVLFGVDDNELATDSDVKNLELMEAQQSTPLFGANPNNVYYGTLLDLTESERLDFNYGWYNKFFNETVYNKDTIKKIEFKAGVEINNRTWDLLVVDDENVTTDHRYRILSKTNVTNSLWSWNGFNCNSFYSYAPYTEGAFVHEGAEIHKYLTGSFYNSFPEYYKNNMVFMDEKEAYWSTGTLPEMHDLHTKVRIPVPDEVDYLDYNKLKNDTEWWIAENIHRADGVSNAEGAAVFPADGNYDRTHGGWSFTNYAVYRVSKGVRPVIAVTKDGLKYDPSAANGPSYTYEIYNKDDTTDPDRKLIGLAYLFDATGGGYNLQINMLYDNAFKINDATALFTNFNNCKEIKGLDLLDFSITTEMLSMFDGCSTLDTITFANPNLTQFKYTFGTGVTNINSMFKDCEALSNVNFLPDNFAPNATSMVSTFENTKLSAWPTKKNTANVTNMTRMFAKNQSTTFDFDAATLSSCTDVTEMFMDSTSLTKITVNSEFLGLPNNVTTSTDMFKNCPNLVGGGGFRYKAQFADGDFACIDYGGIIPGYLTCTDTSIYNNVDITISTTWRNNFETAGVLTGAAKIIFTHDDLPGGNATDIDMPLKINGVDITGKAFLMDSDGSLIIQFVPQVQKLSTTDSWYEFFKGFTNVTNIEGLDLIDTSTVESFEEAFNNCSNLATISFVNVDVSNVTTIEHMFEGCTQFTGFVGNVPVFSSLENAHYAFKNCSQLSTINIDSFFVPSLLFAKELFRGCSSLTTIYTSQNAINCQLPIDNYNSENMFDGCTSLVGGQGTAYNANYPKHIGMANIDFGGIKPGYFTTTDTSFYSSVIFTIPNTWYDTAKYTRPKNNVKTIMFIDDASGVGDFDGMFDIDGSINNAKFYIKTDTDGKYIVKIHTGCSLIQKTKLAADMSGFFSGFTGLTTVTGFDKVNMTEITNMSAVFKDCSSLTTLDLTDFNTSNITNMNEMFRGCSNLTTITVTTAFVISNTISGDNMFGGCSALVGDHGTTFTSKFAADPVTAVDKTFATLDARHGLDGYFTLSGTATGYDVQSISINTLPATTYYIGENFFPNGLILNVTWNDNVTTQVPYNASTEARFSFNPDTTDALTPTDTTETVTFGGQPVSFTLTINPAIAYTLANSWMTGASINKNTVRSISFAKFPEASPSSVTSEWDIPDSNGLKGYVIADGTENDIVIYAPHVGTIIGAQDSSFLFSDTEPINCFANLTTINNLSYLVTSRMTDMSYMFRNCAKLQTLDLRSFNTVNVTEMASMFFGCEELISVNTSSFNTSKVTNMNSMFSGCRKLTQVNTTNFNTSNVRNFTSMFYNCNEISSLDVSSFNTSGATDMQSMFCDCSNLTALNLSGFNMKLVVNAEKMFKGCSKLTTIGNVTLSSNNISTCKSMFEGCEELININLSSFNTSNIGSDGFDSMFMGCKKVKTISLGNNFVLGNATTLANMFNGCEALESINLSSFSSNSVNDVTAMFKNNRSLKTIVASNSFAVKNKTGNEMFLNCDVLEGGAGTTFAAAGVTDSSYAQVDEGTTNPGYFTWGGDVIITFVGGEGAYGSMQPQTVKRNVTTPLNVNKFRKSGYQFLYWQDAGGNIYTDSITAFESMTLTAQWQPIYVPSGGGPSGGSSNSGGGGSGGGPKIGTNEITPTTYIQTIKTISAVFNDTQVKWNYNPNTNKFKLVANINGQEILVSNGFYIINSTQNNESASTPMADTYYFNAAGDMVTGWLVTLDSKKYFAETAKNMNEGKFIAGWKVVDGEWYFFDFEGAMLVNTWTPDGYLVGADGKWVKTN